MVKQLIRILIWLLIVGLGLAVATQLIPTSPFPLISILAPLLPYVALLFIPLLLAVFLVKNRVQVIASVLVFLLYLPVLSRFYSFGSPEETRQNQFEVLSYNVSFFSFPTLFRKDYFDTAYDHRVLKARPWILALGSDVVCLQEFFNDENSKVYNTVDSMTAAGYGYYFNAKPRHQNGTKRGIATFSKFPILEEGLVTTSTENVFNSAIYTDLQLPTDTVRLINLHLRSAEFKGGGSKMTKIKSFARGYRTASHERARQVSELMTFVEDSPYAVMVVGDFNETPFSFNFRQVNRTLQNAHQAVGSGQGNTFRLADYLGVRIDHMFTSPELQPIDFQVMDEATYSAHFPIKGNFILRNE